MGVTSERPTIPATTNEPTDDEREPVSVTAREVNYMMQPVAILCSIPEKVTRQNIDFSPGVGPAVKSIAVLRNGQIDMVVRDESVERWYVTDLLERTSYTVSRSGEGYALSLASNGGFIVADVDPTADIPEVAQALAQLARPS